MNWRSALSSLASLLNSAAPSSQILPSQNHSEAAARPSGVLTLSAAALWSRSAGLLSQTGNADAELKTRVSHDAGDDFRRLARELDMNTSELLRVLVLTRLYGVEGVARMTSDHLHRVAGVGTEKAL